jgi:glycosyltransferase involved in cell wall biosynthesis
MSKISVVIPTYKEPEALDLCLKSCIEGQTEKNEIIVVVDGFYDINKEVLDKYKEHISILNLEENVGMIRAMNLGHYNASNELVLHIQDDNVFPVDWDTRLKSQYKPGCIFTPNQIEPTPSIFQQFHIRDFGRTPETFKLEEFRVQEVQISKEYQDDKGSSFPIFISKKDYLKVGGFDETYPGPWVVDWEFFMKCSMNGLKTIRLYNVSFYHFVSLGTKSDEQKAKAFVVEGDCHNYFRYKWGSYAKRNSQTNRIFID